MAPMQNQEVWGSERGNRVWTVLGIATLILFAYIPILHVAGLGRWMLGGRWFSATPVTSTLLYFVLYFIGIYGVVIWPATTLKRRNNAVACLLAVLFSLPLVSFTAWQGNARAWWEIADGALLIVPAAWLAVHCSLRTQKHFTAAFFLAGVTFLPVFVVNDILAPYPVLFGFSAKLASFPYWSRNIRAIAALVCLPLPLLWSWNQEREEDGGGILPREFLHSLKPRESN